MKWQRGENALERQFSFQINSPKKEGQQQQQQQQHLSESQHFHLQLVQHFTPSAVGSCCRRPQSCKTFFSFSSFTILSL